MSCQRALIFMLKTGCGTPTCSPIKLSRGSHSTLCAWSYLVRAFTEYAFHMILQQDCHFVTDIAIRVVRVHFVFIMNALYKGQLFIYGIEQGGSCYSACCSYLEPRLMEDHLNPCSIERETQVNSSLTSKASHLTFHLPTRVRWAHNAKQYLFPSMPMELEN